MSIGNMRVTCTMTINVCYLEALAVIMSEYYPYADNRDLGSVFEAMIEERLTEEKGRLLSLIHI